MISGSTTSTGLAMRLDLATWREKIEHENSLRATWQRFCDGREKDALWSGWYALKQSRIEYERVIVAMGGLLCLVAP